MVTLSVSLSVRVTPRGGRDAIIGMREDGVLLLRVAAAPVDGAANRSCIALLSDYLGTPRSRIQLTGGATGRDKRFLIETLTEAERDAILRKTQGEKGEAK